MSPLTGCVAAITWAGTTGILAATFAALYRGSRDTGATRRVATTTAAAAATFFGAWAVASALFAHFGGYRTQLGKQPPAWPGMLRRTGVQAAKPSECVSRTIIPLRSEGAHDSTFGAHLQVASVVIQLNG